MDYRLHHTAVGTTVLLRVFPLGYRSDQFVLSGNFIGSKGFLIDNTID